MATTDGAAVSFDDTDSRRDEMQSTIDGWLDELVDAVDDAQASELFQRWLDVQSVFHDYSYRNTLLIERQCPVATKVAGYRTWQSEFDRHVSEGEQAIWIWAPIVTERCPRCENAESYHDQSDCAYDETPPEEWDRGLVGFKPVPVFDVSQTEGEPLPELKTAAKGEADGLVDRLLDAAADLRVTAEVVPAEAWGHGDANGVCTTRHPIDCQPHVEVKQRPNRADLAGTLIHEYAHAVLHVGTDDASERSKREVEAEAVAYAVGRHFGLDMRGSAFYLAAWESENPTAVRERLARISSTAQELIETVDRTPQG